MPSRLPSTKPRSTELSSGYPECETNPPEVLSNASSVRKHRRCHVAISPGSSCGNEEAALEVAGLASERGAWRDAASATATQPIDQRQTSAATRSASVRRKSCDSCTEILPMGNAGANP